MKDEFSMVEESMEARNKNKKPRMKKIKNNKENKKRKGEAEPNTLGC